MGIGAGASAGGASERGGGVASAIFGSGAGAGGGAREPVHSAGICAGTGGGAKEGGSAASPLSVVAAMDVACSVG
jgi:hypothetical protein